MHATGVILQKLHIYWSICSKLLDKMLRGISHPVERHIDLIRLSQKCRLSLFRLSQVSRMENSSNESRNVMTARVKLGNNSRLSSQRAFSNVRLHRRGEIRFGFVCKLLGATQKTEYRKYRHNSNESWHGELSGLTFWIRQRHQIHNVSRLLQGTCWSRSKSTGRISKVEFIHLNPLQIVSHCM